MKPVASKIVLHLREAHLGGKDYCEIALYVWSSVCHKVHFGVFSPVQEKTHPSFIKQEIE